MGNPIRGTEGSSARSLPGREGCAGPAPAAPALDPTQAADGVRGLETHRRSPALRLACWPFAPRPSARAAKKINLSLAQGDFGVGGVISQARGRAQPLPSTVSRYHSAQKCVSV